MQGMHRGLENAKNYIKNDPAFFAMLDAAVRNKLGFGDGEPLPDTAPVKEEPQMAEFNPDDLELDVE